MFLKIAHFIDPPFFERKSFVHGFSMNRRFSYSKDRFIFHIFYHNHYFLFIHVCSCKYLFVIVFYMNCYLLHKILYGDWNYA